MLKRASSTVHIYLKQSVGKLGILNFKFVFQRSILNLHSVFMCGVNYSQNFDTEKTSVEIRRSGWTSPVRPREEKREASFIVSFILDLVNAL